jgi:hypothetical protein
LKTLGIKWMSHFLQGLIWNHLHFSSSEFFEGLLLISPLVTKPLSKPALLWIFAFESKNNILVSTLPTWR